MRSTSSSPLESRLVRAFRAAAARRSGAAKVGRAGRSGGKRGGERRRGMGKPDRRDVGGPRPFAPCDGDRRRPGACRSRPATGSWSAAKRRKAGRMSTRTSVDASKRTAPSRHALAQRNFPAREERRARDARMQPRAAVRAGHDQMLALVREVLRRALARQIDIPQGNVHLTPFLFVCDVRVDLLQRGFQRTHL